MKIFIIEKNAKKISEIDKKIIAKKDKIQKLSINIDALESEQYKSLLNIIKELEKRISLLEVEYDVVRRYNNTYRMSEIKLEIINKKYKIQTINDEINLLDKEKINNIEFQINSLKKYIASLEEENLNDVYDSNMNIFKKNELDIDISNKQMNELKEKLKNINKKQIEIYNSDIQKIYTKLSNLERSYMLLKNQNAKGQVTFKLKNIEKDVAIEKENLQKLKATLIELKNKEIFDTNLDNEYFKNKINKLLEYYKKAKILKNNFKIEKISEMLKKYKYIVNDLTEHSTKLKINNENRIEREIEQIYIKLDKLKLFLKKSIINHNDYAVQKTKTIIEDERSKLAKLTAELREIRKEKDIKLQKEIDNIYHKIKVFAVEYQKAKKNNDKKKMSEIEKEEDLLNPKLKQLNNEYFKLRNIEKDRMKVEIDYLNKKMSEMEENVNIGNKEKNKLRLQELSRELTEKRNAYAKYTLVSMKRIVK